MSGNQFERRLTCNRIFRHLTFYHLQGFTGKITVLNQQGENWNFYLALGNLMWADGGNFPLRRWRRQFYATVGQVPELRNIDVNTPCWDFKTLRSFTENNWLSPQQIKQIIQGMLLEVLFDVVQAFEAPIYEHFQPGNTLLSLSQLTGIGDGMQIKMEEGVTPDSYYRLPHSLLPTLEDLQKITYHTWKKWVKAGLACISPNEAPILIKPEELKSRVSRKVYYNISKNIKGKTSLRDLAFKFKHGLNFTKVALALAPYYQQNLIKFTTINDLHVNRINSQSYSTMTLSESKVTLSEAPEEKPFLMAINPTREKQSLLSAIAQEQGYELEVINNSLEAVHKLSQYQKQPQLIFAPYEMSILSGAEFCHIIRRLESLQTTPIVIYTNLVHQTRKTRKVLNYGLTELLDYHQVTYNHLSSLIVKYGQREQGSKETIQDAKATIQQKDNVTSAKQMNFKTKASNFRLA